MSALLEKVPFNAAYLEIDRAAFQYAYRSIVECDDMTERCEALERALLAVMNEQAAGLCMAAIHATLAGENRRCREQYNGETPHVLLPSGDWGFAPEPPKASDYNDHRIGELELTRHEWMALEP